MNANKLERGSNRRGAVLMTVLTVSVFAAILLTAVISFVGRAHTNAYNNYNSEQAYYIASSTVLSINEYLKDGGNYNDILNLAGKGPGTVSFTNPAVAGASGAGIGDFIPGGDCTVTVTEMGTAYLKVSVKGTCNGQEEIINAYYNISPGTSTAGISNALYCDSDASFSLAAGTTGGVTSRNDIVVGNQCRSAGSLVTGGHFSSAVSMDWKGDADTTAGSFIVVNKCMYLRNSGTNFIPTGYKGFDPVLDDNNHNQFISIGGGFACSGNTFQIGADSYHEMDVYCNAMFLGGMNGTYRHYKSNSAYEGGSQGNLIMYGNMYCFKEDTPDPSNNYDGTFVVTDGTASLNLTGNLYVEGNVIQTQPSSGRDLYINGHVDSDTGAIVGGILYLTPSSQMISSGTSPSNNGFVCNAVSGADITDVMNWMQKGVLKIRRNPNVNGAYLSAGELASMDPAARAAYVQSTPVTRGSSSSRNYQPSVDFADYERSYEKTEEFVTNTRASNPQFNASYVEAQSKSLTGSGFATNVNDNDVGMTFDYVVTDNCYIEALEGKKVLIDLNQFDTDYAVIYLKNYQNIYYPPDSGAKITGGSRILIKNGIRNEKGEWTTPPKKYLYIIMEKTSSGGRLFMDNSYIADYYTYKYILQDVTKRGLNLTTSSDSITGAQTNFWNETAGYTYKNSGNYGLYTPSLGRYSLMLNSNDKMDLQNRCFIEAVTYMPGATINASGAQAPDKIMMLKDATPGATMEDLAPQADTGLLFLGAMVCDHFNGHQTFGVSFVPAADGLGVGGSGGGAATTVTFSHYESR